MIDKSQIQISSQYHQAYSLFFLKLRYYRILLKYALHNSVNYIKYYQLKEADCSVSSISLCTSEQLS